MAKGSQRAGVDRNRPLLGLDPRLERDLAITGRLRTPIWIIDADTRRICWANAAALAVWGADSLEAAAARDVEAEIGAMAWQRLGQYREALAQRSAAFTDLWPIPAGAGKPHMMQVALSGMMLPDGRAGLFCEGLVGDATTPESLRGAEALLHTPTMISLYDGAGDPLYQNLAARQALDRVGPSLAARFVGRDEYDAARRTLARTGEMHRIARVRTAQGVRWHAITARLCRDAVTGAQAILLSEVDITDLKEGEDKANFLASHDGLTGLPNRPAFRQRCRERLDIAAARDEKLGLLFIDLDRFKTINDSLGYPAGDEVLVEVARRLRRVVDASDIVARPGGDEFLVLVAASRRAGAIEAAAERIVEAIGRPIAIQKRKLGITPSIGISVFPDDGDDVDTLMKHADLAMYEAKDHGRNGFRHFSRRLKEKAETRLEMESSIQQALDNQEFELFYQPRVATADLAIIGAEALVRWRHPTRGLIMPDDFIPFCEETGLIQPLGEWVLRRAAAQQKAWQDQGFDLTVAINLSPRQFYDWSIVPLIAGIVMESGCDPRRLEIEITESMLMERDDWSAAAIESLSTMGIKISIDDFGTGYSNLANLQNYPVDCLKIDRSFIAELTKNRAITEMIISLCKLIGMTVVAEGVETASQLAWLRERGCQEFQGYYFSPPVTVDAFERLLRNDARQPAGGGDD